MIAISLRALGLHFGLVPSAVWWRDEDGSGAAMITFHSQTIRDAITRDVIERARDAGDRMVIEAGYRCLAAWRLGRQAPREDLSLVREFGAG